MRVSFHGVAGRPVVLPVEAGVHDDALRDRVGVVGLVADQVGVLAVGLVRQHVARVPQDGPLDRLRVGIDQQLVRVEAVPAGGVPRAVHPERVALPGADAREVPVPVEGGPLRQVDARLAVLAVEQAELDAGGVLAEQREVGAGAVPGGAEGKGPPRPHRHRATAPDHAGRRSVVPSKPASSSVASTIRSAPLTGTRASWSLKLPATRQSPRYDHDPWLAGTVRHATAAVRELRGAAR